MSFKKYKGEKGNGKNEKSRDENVEAEVLGAVGKVFAKQLKIQAQN